MSTLVAELAPRAVLRRIRREPLSHQVIGTLGQMMPKRFSYAS